MENHLRYHIGNERFAVSSPSVADIKSCIDQMDNDIRTWFTVNFPSGILSVVGGNQDRFMVIFHSRNKDIQSLRLVDPQYLESNEVIEISAEGIINDELLYQTVPKEIAYRASTHFLLHDELLEGLNWE